MIAGTELIVSVKEFEMEWIPGVLMLEWHLEREGEVQHL